MSEPYIYTQKTGKNLKKNKFLFETQSLEIVSSYTYLGILLSTSESLNNAITHLCSKATKAMFKLRNSIFHTNIKPYMALKLFHTMIRQIATYGGEIWGTFINNIPPMFDLGNNNYKTTDNWCYEKLDLRFCKSLLGVHRKANNIVTRGELGRAPMALHIIKLMLKNWLRIVSYEQNTVLHNTYLAHLSLLSNSKSCWLSNNRSLVAYKLGETHVWENQGSTKHDLIKHLMSNLTNRFNLQWTKALIVTKLRISAHSL